MRHTWIASGLFAAALMSVSPATAGIFPNSIEERAAAVREQTEGVHTYHAYLARELATIAGVEKSQHDGADRQFMNMAEEEAAKAGGK